MQDVCEVERFLKDVETHQMTIIQNDGVYRHIRFSKPGTSCYRFDLITWPGYLCYTGDMGTYVFTRLQDMFDFFRRGSRDGEWHKIDMRYWAEKCEASDKSDGIRQFSEELFKRNVMEHLIDWIRSHRQETTKEERRGLWDAVISEVINAEDDNGGMRKQIAANDFHHEVSFNLTFYFQDFWERSVTEYSFRFVWCCFALAWGIAKYDETQIVKQAA